MILWFLTLAACGEPVSASTCDALCTQLVQDCEFGAYPTYESCEQGCLFAESEGADIEGEQACIARAECDTFAILECEHTFGTTE